MMFPTVRKQTNARRRRRRRESVLGGVANIFDHLGYAFVQT